MKAQDIRSIVVTTRPLPPKLAARAAAHLEARAAAIRADAAPAPDKRCGSCGAKNRPTAKFCDACGSKLPAKDAAPDKPTPDDPAKDARATVTARDREMAARHGLDPAAVARSRVALGFAS